ncbi:MAG: DMT family transporter [Desulfobacteraceae bacterium]|nr:DMT family transporter [Desulfobacteraceae bacterium]
MNFTGGIIALFTVLFWTLSVQLFEAASKRIGSTSVNIIRISIAVVLFCIILFIKDGYIIPSYFPMRAWIYLSLSGVIGFFLGDIFLFKAFVEIGPRVTMLIMSLSAPVAALIGWFFLNETYIAHQWIGMFVTLSGVALVILEKDNTKKNAKPNLQARNITPKGIIFGIGGMLGQAVGFILSKTGMQTESGYLDAIASTQIRAMAAFVCFVLLFTLTKRWGAVKHGINNKQALTYTAIGSALGPVAGVSLSLLALHYMTVGVASTIFSLVPVALIPFAIFLHKERVSFKAMAGALLAVCGIFLLAN